MGRTEEAGGLRSISGKDSSSPSGPFTTFKDMRGAETTRCLSEIPVSARVCPQSYRSLPCFPATCTCSLAEKLSALNCSCSSPPSLPRWGVPLAQGRPAQAYLAWSLLHDGRGLTGLSYSTGTVKDADFFYQRATSFGALHFPAPATSFHFLPP